MAARLALIALGALALSGCATHEYGYAYCYDPYRGPVGYHYGPFEPPPPCAAQTAQAADFVAHEAGYRGTYVSGPYPRAPAPADAPAGP